MSFTSHPPTHPIPPFFDSKKVFFESHRSLQSTRGQGGTGWEVLMNICLVSLSRLGYGQPSADSVLSGKCAANSFIRKKGNPRKKRHHPIPIATEGAETAGRRRAAKHLWVELGLVIERGPEEGAVPREAQPLLERGRASRFERANST